MRPDRAIGHFGECFEWLALGLGLSLARANVSRLGDFGPRCRTSCVKLHALRPFVIRADPDVYLLVERDVRLRCWGNGRGDAPIRGKQGREQTASHPGKILKQRHSARTLSAPGPNAIRDGMPR
jgi:hypothetical protein